MYSEKAPFFSKQHAASDKQSPGAIINDHFSKQSTPKKAGRLQHPTKTLVEAISSSQTDNSSFLPREAESRTVEKRAGEEHLSKKNHSRFNSRFRENFESSNSRHSFRSSLADRIHLALPRQFRGRVHSLDTTQDENVYLKSPQKCTGKPESHAGTRHKREMSSESPMLSNLSLRSPIRPFSPDLRGKSELERQESATNLWQRAIRMEAEERNGSSDHKSSSTAEHRQGASSKCHQLSSVGSRAGSPTNGSTATRNHTRQRSQLTPSADEISFEDRSRTLIQTWVTHMRPEGSMGGEGVGNSQKRYTLPPASWARFPSHTRDKRNGCAIIEDNVLSEDFAVTRTGSNGEILWVTDKTPADIRGVKDMSRSFSAKVGQAVKFGFGKFVHRKQHDRDCNAIIPQDHTTRTSSHTAQAEYPELMITPTEPGFQELQVLEREIQKLKGGPQPQASNENLSQRRSSKSLRSRISAMMHEVAVEPQHCNNDAVTLAEYMNGPVTPSPRKTSGTSTGTFITPMSHLSVDAATLSEKENSDGASTKGERLAVHRSSRSVCEPILCPRSPTCRKRSRTG